MECKKCKKECLETELKEGFCNDCIKKLQKIKGNRQKNVIIVLIIIIFLLLIYGFFFYNQKKEQKVDASLLSLSELIDFFQEEKYEIRITDIDGTVYIILENDLEGITIQKIPDTLLGTMMTFCDNTINDEMADILDLSRNDTKEEQEQYKAFKNWLEYYNVKKEQISDMLDYYYSHNKEKTNYIDTNKLLKEYN